MPKTIKKANDEPKTDILMTEDGPITIESPLEGGAILPDFGIINKALDYAEVKRWADEFVIKAETLKAGPPNLQPFTTITTVPDVAGNGVLPWPGTDPQNIKRLSREHIAVNMVLSQRVMDVLQYSQESKYLWKPGWRIVSVQPEVDMDENVRKKVNKDIAEATRFIKQCCDSDITIIDRDKNKLKTFPQFLAAATRDLLTYDAIAIWKETRVDGRIRSFAGIDASQITLIDPEKGYLGDKSIMAIAQNVQLQEVVKFKRNELIWAVMNPRFDSDIYGYGLSPIDILGQLIYAFTNAIRLNSSIFDKNAIPTGILKLTGKFTQKQVNELNRLWTNMKTGPSKAWTFPVINVPVGGDVTILDMTNIKGNETYFTEFMNMLMGAICAVWAFPIRRLGYHISGTPGDAKPTEADQKVTWKDEADVGKGNVLQFFEDLINNYIIEPTYPTLRFMFTGKSPKEDAREFEMRANSLTLDERRIMVGLPRFVDIIPKDVDDSETMKKAAQLMGMIPVDTALVGAFQNIVMALFKQPSSGASAIPGAISQGQKDPVESERHGDMAGVRRRTPK